MSENKQSERETPALVAFGISEEEAKRFAKITAGFFDTLFAGMNYNETAAATITAAWVQSTIEGIYRVSAENLRRENAKTPQAEPVDYLKALRDK